MGPLKQSLVEKISLFYISDITNSSSFNGKICRKKSMLENFRANVLKLSSGGEPGAESTDFKGDDCEDDVVHDDGDDD